MDEYTLYLDESYTYEHNGKNPAFAMGGFIIKNTDSTDVNIAIDNINKIPRITKKRLVIV